MKYSPEAVKPKKSTKAIKVAGAALAATSVFSGLSHEVAYAQPSTAAAIDYISDNEKKIMSAATVLDSIIADSNAAVSAQKVGRNTVISARIVRDGQTISVEKIDGKYVDTYTAEKEYINGKTQFINIFRDATIGAESFVVVAGEVKNNEIVKAATYNGGIDAADARYAVTILNEFN